MRNRSTITAVILAAGFLTVSTGCATGPGEPEEGGPAPRPGRGGRGMGPGQPGDGGRWQPYDVNADGKVTRVEFLAVRGLCFIRYDSNEDSTLTQAEMRRRLPDRLAEGFGTAVARMDRDRDGEISRGEFDQESDRLFQFLDTNRDGVIAGMEVTALTSGPPGDICQPSGSRDAGEGRGTGDPSGGPGPRNRR